MQFSQLEWRSHVSAADKSHAPTEFGVRCVFDNHNLDTDLPAPLVRIYALMKKLGPEIVFQTGHRTPPDFEGTIKLGVAHGATSIELWQDSLGFPLVPDPLLRRWAAMVEANKTR